MILICAISVMIGYCTGLALPPSDLSVEYSYSSALVSFQSPVYGEECVDQYVVTAVGSEENITCDPTEDTFAYNCNIPPNRNINNFNFTIHSVTTGVDGVAHDGGALTDCCKFSQDSVEHIFFRSLFSRECECSGRIVWCTKDGKHLLGG